MTTREWQHGVYIRDRWQVNDKLTLNGGLRFEFYPTMTRADRGGRASRLRHLERPDRRPRRQPEATSASTGKPVYVAPRIGAAYRIDDNTVFRTGYGITVNPTAVVAAAARLLPGDDCLQQLGGRFPATSDRLNRASPACRFLT